MHNVELFRSLAFKCGASNKMVTVNEGDVIEIELYGHDTHEGKLVSIEEESYKDFFITVDCSKNFNSNIINIYNNKIKYIEVIKSRFDIDNQERT